MTSWLNRLLFVLGALALCGLVLGSVTDYQLDLLLYNPESLFAALMAVFASAPLFWNLAAAVLLFEDQGRKSDAAACRSQPARRLVCGIILAAIAVYNGYGAFSQLCTAGFSYGSSLLLSLLLCLLLIALPAWMFFRELERQRNLPRTRVVLFLIIFSLGQLLLVNILKLIWARPRFYLVAEIGSSAFEPWYSLNRTLKQEILPSALISPDAFKSFPSAHTSSAACILALTLLRADSDRTNHSEKTESAGKRSSRNRLLLSLLIIGWIVMTALSRMIAGMHFLSDVSAGLLVSLLWYLGCRRLFFHEHRASRSQYEKNRP